MTDWSDYRDFIVTLIVAAIPIVTTDVRLGRLAVGYRGNPPYRGYRVRGVCGILPLLHRCRVGHRWWRLGLTCLVQLGWTTKCHLKFIIEKRSEHKRSERFVCLGDVGDTKKAATLVGAF